MWNWIIVLEVAGPIHNLGYMRFNGALCSAEISSLTARNFTKVFTWHQLMKFDKHSVIVATMTTIMMMMMMMMMMMAAAARTTTTTTTKKKKKK